MNIGEKLRQLRLFRNLTQEEMADRCELSKGFISLVERDLTSPSIATLTDMLECLGSSLQEFFSEAKDNKIVFSADDMFEKADDDTYLNKITWLVPSAQKNSMEPIMLELQENGRSSTVPAHEGEEFGYVLSGSVTLVLGSNRYRVRTGESFCIHPRSEHYLINNTKRPAKLLWVSNPPNF